MAIGLFQTMKIHPVEEQFCFLDHQYVIKLLDPPCDSEIECQTIINTNYFLSFFPTKLIIIPSSGDLNHHIGSILWRYPLNTHYYP